VEGQGGCRGREGGGAGRVVEIVRAKCLSVNGMSRGGGGVVVEIGPLRSHRSYHILTPSCSLEAAERSCTVCT